MARLFADDGRDLALLRICTAARLTHSTFRPALSGFSASQLHYPWGRSLMNYLIYPLLYSAASEKSGRAALVRRHVSS